MEIAIERFRMFEPPEGYYLAFSGGKDSQCIYHLAKMSGVKFDAHYNLTTVDPPELVRFIRKNYKDVEIHYPEKSMWKLLIENGTPPLQNKRYCCRILKERGGTGRFVVTGIRKAESNKRFKRKMVEINRDDTTIRYLNPIIDWLDSDVWEFIKTNNIEYCKLYDDGYKRLGCIMCPMKNTRGMEYDGKRFPQYYRAYLNSFQRMLDNRLNKKLDTTWKTPEEIMEWWIYRTPKKDDGCQIGMFE